MLPTIPPAPGETGAHQFKFWEKTAQGRVPYVMQLDKEFNLVSLAIDPSRAQADPPRRMVVWKTDAQGRRVSADVSPELVAAHKKVVGKRVLDDPAEEAVRQRYEQELANMKEAAGEAGCSGCDLGALVRKFQDEMLNLNGPVRTPS